MTECKGGKRGLWTCSCFLERGEENPKENILVLMLSTQGSCTFITFFCSTNFLMFSFKVQKISRVTSKEALLFRNRTMKQGPTTFRILWSYSIYLLHWTTEGCISLCQSQHIWPIEILIPYESQNFLNILIKILHVNVVEEGRCSNERCTAFGYHTPGGHWYCHNNGRRCPIPLSSLGAHMYYVPA